MAEDDIDPKYLCRKCRGFLQGQTRKARNDIAGKVYGRLTAIKPLGQLGADARWLFECSCGNTKVIRRNLVTSAKTRSCGCLQRELVSARLRKAGGLIVPSSHKLYGVYTNMLWRCHDARAINFHRYGGRGITVCDEWRESRNSFFRWALDAGYAEGLELDRIDNNKGYMPENCRWATVKVNSNNKSTNRLVTFRGETMTLAELADAQGIPYNTLGSRLRTGWSVESAGSTPVRAISKGQPRRIIRSC